MTEKSTLAEEVKRVIITAETELARREEIEKIAGELLSEANVLQNRATNLRTLAHRLRLLINDDRVENRRDKARR